MQRDPEEVLRMTRVALVDSNQAPLLARPYYQGGQPGPIEASLAAVPELLDTAMPFFAAVLGPSALPARLKEIAIVRTSVLQACRYCVDAHTVVALDTGLSLDEVRALRGEPVGECFTDPAERALLAWVEAVAGSQGPIDDPIAASLAEYFAEHLVVEITLLVATTLLLNRYCTALELPTSLTTAARLAEAGL
jgi:AhpD family alkylhydroperoxidase